MPDPYDLQRFVDEQDGTYEQALAEIRAGEKQSHWIWFVFPQVTGLGSSPMSQRFAIRTLGEAQAYLAHPVLGPRLRECAAAMDALPGSSAADVLGDIDAMKFQSSMTLFDAATPNEPVFSTALQKYFAGRRDPRSRRRRRLGNGLEPLVTDCY